MKQFTIFAFLLFLSIATSAQDIKKTLKAFEKGEFLKAKEALEKNLAENENHVASDFLMAFLLAEDEAPTFDIVEAWQYIEAIKGKEKDFTPDELEELKEFFLAIEERKSSRPPLQKIERAIERIEGQLIKYIREENDLEAVYEVLERYPDYKHHDNVVHIRNQFEYRKYEKQNTVEAYNEFLEKFPDAAQVEKAKTNRNKLAFDLAKKENSEEAYNAFINNYPESIYLQKAIVSRNEVAYEKAKTSNTLAKYEAFVDNYPDAFQVGQAKQEMRDLLYAEAKRIKSLEAYNKFIKLYPDGALFIDVFNLKATELGTRYYNTLGFTSPDFVSAKAFDNKEQYDEARAFAVGKDNSCIIAGTTKENDSACTDVWVVKIDANGNMLWDNIVGQRYNEQVKDIFITSDNSVVVVGYTQIASDSSDYSGWMFMLDADGKKKWNRNIGKLTIAACTLTADDRLFMSSYVQDTVPDTLEIHSYSLDGKKGWGRKYCRAGTFSDIEFTSEGDVTLVGDNWLARTDPKFYIKWEDTLDVGGRFMYADYGNDLLSVVTKDSVDTYYYRYTPSGEKKLKTRVMSDSAFTVRDVFTAADNTTLIIGERPTGNHVMKIDAGATKISHKKFTTPMRIAAVKQDTNGDILYLFSGKDYVLLRYKSVGF